MTAYEIRALSSATWEAFAELAERNSGGGMGGCYCTWFHREKHGAPKKDAPPRLLDWTREFKHRLVEAGQAHAALVFEGGKAVGWAQYGSPAELPGIHHRKQYEATATVLPDYRITCFTVDRKHRGAGVAIAALDGALRLIAEAGGGLVEAYPQDTPGRKVSSTFLYSVTRPMFERAGFVYDRPKGINHCVMRRIVEPVRPGA